MTTRTIFLGKLLGLYCLLVGVSMVVQKAATIATLKAIVYSPPLMYIAGVIALGAGLAIVLGHNIWSGGPLPVVVTLVGWISLIKGLLALYLPSHATVGFVLGGLHYSQLFYVYAAVALVLGVYLTYAGFRAAAATRH